jgi:glycosyltransferase involved in cell wall biosynthesis
MTKAPLISVLVTVYNRERYLAECIESILASTWTDFELIIVDDNSCDKSVSIARSFEKKDNRIRFFQNPVNLGDYPNRNKAASLATGHWLKYVDSDDKIHPNCLTTMMEATTLWPEAKLILSYPRPQNRDRPFLLHPEEALREHFIYQQGILCAGPLLALINKGAFTTVGGFRPNARNMGDTILWLELCCKWPMVVTHSDLTFWRQHSEQEYQLVRCGGWDNTNMHCQLSNVILRDFITPSCPLPKEDVRRIRRQIHLDNTRRLFWHLKHLRFMQFWHEFAWTIQMLTANYPGCLLRNSEQRDISPPTN